MTQAGRSGFPEFSGRENREKIVRDTESESRKSSKNFVSRKFGFPIFLDRDREIPKIPKMELVEEGLPRGSCSSMGRAPKNLITRPSPHCSPTATPSLPTNPRWTLRCGAARRGGVAAACGAGRRRDAGQGGDGMRGGASAGGGRRVAGRRWRGRVATGWAGAQGGMRGRKEAWSQGCGAAGRGKEHARGAGVGLWGGRK